MEVIQQNEGNSGVTPSPQGCKPNNHLVGAILSTIFCCLPFGIVSIVYASQVDSQWYAGNYRAAEELAQKANRWMWVGIISSLILCFFYIILVFFGVFATVLSSM